VGKTIRNYDGAVIKRNKNSGNRNSVRIREEDLYEYDETLDDTLDVNDDACDIDDDMADTYWQDYVENK